MKKQILLIPLFCLSLFSCQNNKTDSSDKLYISSIENIDSFIYLNEDDFTTLLNLNKDFIIFLGQKGCSTCEEVMPYYKNYIKNSSLPIYYLDTSIYLKMVNSINETSSKKLPIKISSASLLSFKKGELLNYYGYIDYYDNFSSSKKLNSFLDSLISPSYYIEINDLTSYTYTSSNAMYQMSLFSNVTLDKIIKNNSLILYSWASCPDCQSLKNDFLDQYLLKNKKHLYIFEVYGVHQTDDYLEFKNKYQFNDYLNGVVPTFVEYEKSQKKSMCVYLNDVINNIDSSYQVTNSFYNEIIGMKNDDLNLLKKQIKEKEIDLISSYLNFHL